MTTQEEIAGEAGTLSAASATDGTGGIAAERWIHLLCLALFIAVFAPTMVWLVGRWTARIYFEGHNLFIPILVVWLFRDVLRREQLAPEAGSALGFAFLIPALFLRILDLAIHTEVLSAFALFAALPGLSLLLLGRQHTRALLFPLLLTFFMLPFPAGAVAPVHQVLRDITAWGTAQLIPWFGVIVARDGTVLNIPTGSIIVSDACSGFSTFYAAMTLALILAYMARSARKRIEIFAAAVVLAIVCNVVRVTLLVLMAHYIHFDILSTFAHEASGLVAFAVTLVALFMIVGRTPPAEAAT